MAWHNSDLEKDLLILKVWKNCQMSGLRVFKTKK